MGSSQIATIHNLMADIAGSYDLLFSGMLLEMKLLLCHLKYPCTKVSDTLNVALCFVMPSSAPVLHWVGELPLLFACRALTDVGDVSPRVAVHV